MTKTTRMPALRAALYGAANLLWYGCLLAICAALLTTCAPAPAHAAEAVIEIRDIQGVGRRMIDHETGVVCYLRSGGGTSCVQFKEAQR